MTLKTCRKGLHQYDTETAPKVGDHPTCPACLRAARARYLSGDKGQQAVARYRSSEKGRVTWRRQDERQRLIEAVRRAELRRVSGLDPG